MSGHVQSNTEGVVMKGEMSGYEIELRLEDISEAEMREYEEEFSKKFVWGTPSEELK